MKEQHVPTPDEEEPSTSGLSTQQNHHDENPSSNEIEEPETPQFQEETLIQSPQFQQLLPNEAPSTSVFQAEQSDTTADISYHYSSLPPAPMPTSVPVFYHPFDDAQPLTSNMQTVGLVSVILSSTFSLLDSAH